MCHKPAQIDNTASCNTDTIYITCYNDSAFFSNFFVKIQAKHSFHDICKGSQYGMIKYNPKHDKFVVVHKDGQMAFHPEIGKID